MIMRLNFSANSDDIDSSLIGEHNEAYNDEDKLKMRKLVNQFMDNAGSITVVFDSINNTTTIEKL